MKQLFITEVEQSLLSILDNAQMKALHEAQSNQQLLEMFLSVKRVEGCSEKTLHYYQTTIAKLLQTIEKRVVHITTDDLRQYLADYQQASHCSRGLTTSAAFFPASLHGWRMKTIFSKAPSGAFTKSAPISPSRKRHTPSPVVRKTVKQKGMAAKATPFSLRWQPLSRRKERSNSIRTFEDSPVWKRAFIGSANWKLSI